MPMVYFKESYHFPRFQRGSNIFSRGEGPTFSRGGEGPIAYSLRIPYITCVFPGGSGSLPPPLDQCMQYFPVKKVSYEKKLSILTHPPLGIPKCIHGAWENNHSGLTRIQIVFEFFNGSTVAQW